MSKSDKFMKASFKPLFWLDSFSWTDKEYFNEGLIKTHNPEFCIARLQSIFKYDFGIDVIKLTENDTKNPNVASDKSYVFINYPDNELSDKYCDGVYSKIELGIYRIGMFIYDECNDTVARQEEFADSIGLVCRFCGLYISRKEILTTNAGYIFKFIIEPKFSNKDFELNNYSDIRTFYHITLSTKVEKILKIGLNPKSSNVKFNYPDRIYLGLDPKALEFCLLPNLRKTKGKDATNVPYTILKIAVSKIPSKNRFRIDPNYPDGLFTSDNIPPDAIGVYKDNIG